MTDFYISNTEQLMWGIIFLGISNYVCRHCQLQCNIIHLKQILIEHFLVSFLKLTVKRFFPTTDNINTAFSWSVPIFKISFVTTITSSLAFTSFSRQACRVKQRIPFRDTEKKLVTKHFKVLKVWFDLHASLKPWIHRIYVHGLKLEIVQEVSGKFKQYFILMETFSLLSTFTRSAEVSFQY